MSRSTLIILIVASVLTVLGIAFCLVGLHFDQTLLHTETLETTHEIEESFKSVSVNIQTEDVTLIATDEPTAKVVCAGETEKLKYSVEVRDGTLFIDILDARAWYDHIGIFFAERSVSIYLPKGTYSQLTVNTDTGDVYVPSELSFENASVKCDTGDVSWNSDVSGALKIDTDTGDVEINDLKCKAVEASTDTGRVKLNATCADESIRIETSTGNVILHGVVADGDMTVTTSTGDISFDRCDASELSLTTSTGDVEGSLLSDKIFLCETSTGDVSVPSTTSGGVCKIKTGTGDIIIIIAND